VAWVRKVGRVVCWVVSGERGRGWRWVGLGRVDGGVGWCACVESRRVRLLVERKGLHGDCIE